ncbi:alpha-protein kinase 3-like isoform X2 [Megalops cyprinoides]|uniref:alpha-protein kinase 3-like isoform X2 n=1 Tax=Megalops cyprinoides TaxID=118141 RepID=UPI001863C402|nr:alpha-protein kinase 3-like isoform X2 [Megalops cyprinoides]
MSFRRPMTRSFSGNGRSVSINEEDVPPPSARVDSRNYLHNVRPENRSTLCSVMAQLTEETQPAFETTLKSRAVSEDSNVKFSCVVTGYPVPELTWYKDDMEMDRYCGLPKYEIFRNGNTHTLHIYNCTVEDAAIYQASARNSKGIVSCSGVLEVGTMNEYKIHQRFFAKLKQKASLKKKELEESRRKGKENVLAPLEQLRTISPERPQRKRRSPGEAGLRSPSTPHDGEAEAKKSAQEDEAEARLREGVAESGAELLAAAPEIPNGFPADPRSTPGSEAQQEAAQENGSEGPTYIYEMVEIVTTRRPPKDPLAKKRPKISNGVDGGKGGGSAEQGSGGESEARTEGGMSLAQYLTESSQFEVSKDKQNPPEEVMEVDTTVNQVPAGKETADRQTESLGQVVQSSAVPEVKAEVQPTASKELEPPHSQTPLSSVFFSLRDMFFGSKNNKDRGNKAEDTPEMAHDPPAFSSEPQPYPQTHQWEREDQTEDFNSMEETTQMQAEEKLTAGDARLSISPPYFKTKEQSDTARMQEGQGLKEHVQGDTVTKSMEPGEGKAVMSRLLHEPGGGEVGADKTRGFLEMTCETPPRPSPLCEDAEEHMQTERNEAPLGQDMVAPLSEVGVPEMFTSAGEHATTDASEMNTVHSHGQTAPGALTHGTQPHSGESGDTSTKTETGPQKWGLEIAGNRDSAPEGFSLGSVGIAQDLVKQKDEQVKESVEESEHGSFWKTQADSTALAEERVLVEEQERADSGARKVETESILKTQGEGEEDAVHWSTGESVGVELKPPDVLQQEAALVGIPEVRVLESRITDVPEETVISIPKTEVLESPAKDIIQLPPSLVDNIPASEQSGSVSSLSIAVRDTDLIPAAIPATVTQQVQEAGTFNQKATEGNLSDHHIEISTAPIPIINVCLTGDSALSYDTETNDTKPPSIIMPSVEAQPKGPAFVVPPISVTCADSPPENQPSKDEIKEMELSVTLAQAVKNEQDVEVSLQAPEGEVVEKIVGDKESGMTDSTMVVSREPGKEKQPKETQTFVDQLQKDKPSIENLGFMSPEVPMLSPTTLRRFASKGVPGLEAPLVAVPAILVDSALSGEKRSKEGTGVDTPPSVPSCESSPKLKRRDSLTPIPSATPEELASGARRKIFIPKSKGEGGEGAEKEEAANRKTISPQQEAPYLSPGQSRRAALLQPSAGQQTPPTERRSPLLGRKKATLEVPKRPEEVLEDVETSKPNLKPAEEKTLNPFKAPQVIRKIRGEPFPDAVGHLKLWCQFFNVLSDSTIKWCRDEVEIAEVKRSAGDESQVALALVQTSSRDCGVYSCSIKNEYGTDMTDFLLSADILSEFLLREDLEVGEEIEMTPMVFTKGLADPGNWGNKLFGRIMTEEAHIGEGCNRKACRMKVIYGLEPIFESGTTCIAKVRNPIAYGIKDENNLAERNLEITKQDCKIQNTVREYCKVFSAEARVIENFGPALEVTPLYLMYRPANTIPYATVEADLNGVFLKYCLIDSTGRLVMRTGSEVEQKCCTFQHWIHQWTNGNLLVTHLEGVGMKITNIGIATKSKGYQGLSEAGTPKVFEQFATQHQCNYYCGLLGLRILKSMDSLQQPAKMKGSRSPLLNRKTAPGSSSPQLQKKGVHSPQTVRKAGSSPKVSRKASESGDTKSAPKQKAVETPKAGETS